MERWTDNINGEPYTLRGVRTVRRRAFGNTTIVIWKGAGCLAYVIVSRKDATNKIRLSPMNSSRGRNIAHSKKMGQFDRVAFKQSGEKLFDQLFNFKRNLNETTAYANIKKNGNLAQREQLSILEKGAEMNYQSKFIANELVKGIADGLYETATDMLKSTGKTVAGFLEMLMEPVYTPGSGRNPVEEAEKRRRRKQKGQDQGLSR